MPAHDEALGDARGRSGCGSIRDWRMALRSLEMNDNAMPMVSSPYATPDARGFFIFLAVLCVAFNTAEAPLGHVLSVPVPCSRGGSHRLWH